ncbi:hypothetical protein GWI33_019458 [Rhynchophorus ferrugineus]|uniref:SET domain-containing protein n=1 Tax=Rhynchophorus ferrugineus TaxID=354439 RepID=A0A834HTS4_RHYFE|nr:hypothetical protein GWI33_019458 [Rhynchophorus ferrugineus]
MSKKAELDRAALYDLYRSYARNEKSLLLSEKFGRKSGDEDIAKDDGDGNITVRKNPKRRAKMTVTSYFEGCENEEDRLIFCDNCNKDVLDFCPTCGMLVMISDNPVPMAVPDRAKKTAPKLLDIRSSSIHGLGVFARRPLPAGIKFGPYEGEVTRVSTTNGYSWKLRNGKLIDAADETKSNWLRYVNCAPHMSMQNVVAFQYRGGLYYRTTRLIKTDEELLVYYGDSFARELGIEPKRYFDPTLETVLQDFYCCRYCKIGLSTIKFRDNHELKCRFKKPSVNLEKWYGCKHCPCYLLSESERDLHQKRCERKR